MVNVEIIYIPATNAAIHLRLEMPTGATVADALQQSGLAAKNPEIINFNLGIFSKQVEPQAILKPGDRIEIYRPLTVDPKQKRRERAKASS